MNILSILLPGAIAEAETAVNKGGIMAGALSGVIDHLPALIGIGILLTGVIPLFTGKLTGKDYEKYTEESRNGFARLYGLMFLLCGLMVIGYYATDKGWILEGAAGWVKWTFVGAAVLIFVLNLVLTQIKLKKK